MKHLFKILVPILLLFATTSCSFFNNNDTQTITSFATVVINPGVSDETPSSFYLVDDGGTLLKPTNAAELTTYTPKDNERVIVKIAIEGAITDVSPVPVTVLAINSFSTKSIPVTDKPDTLSKSIVQPQAAWVSGGKFNASKMLNLNVAYYINTDSTPNSFNLYETGLSEDGYFLVRLERKGDCNPEEKWSAVQSYVSYLLESRHTAETVKGFKLTYYSAKDTETTVTFNY